MHQTFSRLALAICTVTLAACSTSMVQPDYESYKTASPYGTKSTRPGAQATPRPEAVTSYAQTSLHTAVRIAGARGKHQKLFSVFYDGAGAAPGTVDESIHAALALAYVDKYSDCVPLVATFAGTTSSPTSHVPVGRYDVTALCDP